MSNGTKGRAGYAFPLDSDLWITLKVVVKFLARMPVPIKLAVGWNLNQINQDLATGSEGTLDAHWITRRFSSVSSHRAATWGCCW